MAKSLHFGLLAAPSSLYSKEILALTWYKVQFIFLPREHQHISIITGELGPASQQSCISQAFVIRLPTSAGKFSVILGPLYNRFAETMHNPDPRDAGKIKDWEVVFWVSWLGTRAEDEVFQAWETAVKEYSNGFSSCPSGLQPSLFSLAVH
ncbi:hypothetical protein F5141DRAFT_1272613 [Pisolithus sp. B1]|nr:hypothetical protein F5141DRAFT_1272613 [Pisolithus sp. B1]